MKILKNVIGTIALGIRELLDTYIKWITKKKFNYDKFNVFLNSDNLSLKNGFKYLKYFVDKFKDKNEY